MIEPPASRIWSNKTLVEETFPKARAGHGKPRKKKKDERYKTRRKPK